MTHLTEMQEIFDKAEAAMSEIIEATTELDALESLREMLLEAITGLINEADVSLDMRTSFRRAIANAHSVSCQVKYGYEIERLRRLAAHRGALNYAADYDAFKQQRDELLAALKIVDERFGQCRDEYIFSKRNALDKVKAAISKAEQA